MPILQIEYDVPDFGGWKAVFDRDPLDRASHGVIRHSIYRTADDPTRVLLHLEFPTEERARAFREVLQPVWDVSGAQSARLLLQEPDTGTTSRYFAYKLIPPRPTFAADMTEAEAAVMAEHVGYWHDLITAGTAVVFGPVADPAGVWGLAVVSAGDADEVRALGAKDPAVGSGLATFEVLPMPDAIARS
ncbi:YciI family protein [Kribbella sp. NPDC050124]|uniref:YciI family protein n=1 Tax=Kribbella sp. NPDC050124 TaxID=3364114 RepID=UPI0037A59C7C